MALRDRIANYQYVATATLATIATLRTTEQRTVAKVATVAVAGEEKKEICSTPSPPAIKEKKTKPSPIALAWLSDHRQALDKAGWTRAELYRRNKSKRGIAWLELWDKAFLLACLHENGMIEFKCSIQGRDYFQTARSASFWARPNDVLSVDQKS